MNEEAKNRCVKALKMIRGLEAFSLMLGHHLEELPFLVDSIESDTWPLLAERCGVNPPSDETIELIKAVLKDGRVARA